MSSPITIKLSDKLEKELNAAVKTEKISKDEIIKDALARYLAIKHFHQIRKKVLPFAEAQGLLTDEDVFQTISRGSFWTPTSSSPPLQQGVYALMYWSFVFRVTPL